MNEHEKRLRAILPTADEATLDAALASAEARCFARTREKAAKAAFSNECEFCKQTCQWDPRGGEGRDGAWEHVEQTARTAHHTARPLGTIGAVERIRAMQDEGGGA